MKFVKKLKKNLKEFFKNLKKNHFKKKKKNGCV